MIKVHSTSNFMRVLFRFAASYLLCLFIPVIILNLALYQSRRIAADNAEKSCISVLSCMRDNVDTQIRFIDDMASYLLLNKDIVSLQYLEKEKSLKDYYTMYLASRKVEPYSTYFDYEVNLYYSNSDVLVTSKYIADDIEPYYGSLYRFGDYTFNQFKDVFASGAFGYKFFPSIEVVSSGKSYQGMIYARTLVAPSDGRGGAYIYFLIEDKTILSMLSSIYSQENCLLIFDGAGNILFNGGSLKLPDDFSIGNAANRSSGHFSDNILGGEYIATYAVSGCGLQYMMVIPKAVAYEQVRSLNNIVWIINIAAIILTIFLILILNYKNSKSFVRLLALTGGNPASLSYSWNGIINRIADVISTLERSNLSLSDRIKMQNDILRTTVIDRLFSGNVFDRSELCALAEQLDIPLQDVSYGVALLQFPDSRFIGANIELLDRFTKDQIKVLEVLQYNFSDMRCFFSHSFDEIGLLFCLNETHAREYRQDVEQHIRKSISQIYALGKMTVRCMASCLFGDIGDVFTHCNICREALASQLSLDTANTVSWSDSMSFGDRGMFEYGSEFENKLINQIKAGDRDGAVESIAGIISRNEELELSPIVQGMFIAQIKITLLKVLDSKSDTEYAESLMRIDSASTFQDLYDFTEALISDICAKYRMKRQKDKDGFKQQLTDYINEHYQDPNLSLRNMADAFKFSETYFSQLFRDLTGCNISTYLEKVRMNESDALLKNSNMKIDEIAKLCGYAATSTFRRAYKRFHGISPSARRGCG